MKTSGGTNEAFVGETLARCYRLREGIDACLDQFPKTEDGVPIVDMLAIKVIADLEKRVADMGRRALGLP